MKQVYDFTCYSPLCQLARNSQEKIQK